MENTAITSRNFSLVLFKGRSLYFLLLLCFTGCSSNAGTKGKCLVDSDCPGNLICSQFGDSSGRCVECDSDRLCPDGYVCSSEHGCVLREDESLEDARPEDWKEGSMEGLEFLDEKTPGEDEPQGMEESESLESVEQDEEGFSGEKENIADAWLHPDGESEVCKPDCIGRECGPDGCGGSCGVCVSGFACLPDGTCRLESDCYGPPAPVPTAFGFDYAPGGHLCKWVGSEYEAVKADFERDLVTMASLGTSVVRIMLLPYCLGLNMEQNAGPGNWDQAELAAMAENLPAVIERFREFGISVVLAFGPNAYYWNGPFPGTKWWEYVYGPDGWGDLIRDMIDWGTRVAEIVETTPACSNVLYYDLHNEVDYSVTGMSELITGQLMDTPIPDAKLGLSILRSTQAADLAADVTATGRNLAFLEFHVYPDRNVHDDVPATAAAVRADFPDVPLLVGEFGGIFCENGRDEDKERATTLAVLDGAGVAGVAAAMHWMLWDRTPGTACDDAERIGLGYGPNLPRDVYGAIATRRGLIDDSDFEEGLGDWYVGGVSSSVTLILEGPSESAAATNLYYGRMRVEAEGLHWFCSPKFMLSESKLAVSGFVRSNLPGLILGIHFYNQDDQDRYQINVPFELPGGWAFSNLQYDIGGKVFDVPAGTKSCTVCVSGKAPSGTSRANPAYVDLDSFSAHGFEPN